MYKEINLKKEEEINSQDSSSRKKKPHNFQNYSGSDFESRESSSVSSEEEKLESGKKEDIFNKDDLIDAVSLPLSKKTSKASGDDIGSRKENIYDEENSFNLEQIGLEMSNLINLEASLPGNPNGRREYDRG